MRKTIHTEGQTPFNILFYKELASSNSEAMRLAIEGAPELTVVVCRGQTAGRGQRNNVWESEAGMNLTFSLILRPTFLPSDLLFLLSKAFSLAVCNVLRHEAQLPATIKWPNDIYVGEKKIAGILLEHSFSGNRLMCSIIGLGLNVNQKRFTSNAPNPSSIAMERGADMDLDTLFHAILHQFGQLYQGIRNGSYNDIAHAYLQSLYRKEGNHRYRLPMGEEFEARIADVLNSGEMVLEQEDGTRRSFAFKEVIFVGET